MASGQQGSVALKELLLGSGTGQLHLSAVRARADELKRSLEQIIQGLQFAADRVQWNDVLDRFAVINVQYQHLLDALRPLLRRFAAYPRSVNQQNAPILPIMLATKLLPEMEEEERQLLQELAQEQAAGAAGAAGGPGPAAGAPPQGHAQAQLSIAEQFAWVQDQERELNHLIDSVTREADSLLGAKSERRKELERALQRAAAPAAPAGPPPPSGPAQARQAQLARQAPQQGREAPDMLLAAIAYGAGLS